jgi:hypothetical protein
MTAAKDVLALANRIETFAHKVENVMGGDGNLSPGGAAAAVAILTSLSLRDIQQAATALRSAK